MGLISTDVDEALNRGELVISWLNRGTLHLVCADDYWWLHQLTTPQLVTGNARRLRQEGVSERALARAIEAVTIAVTEGPRTRAELRSHLDAAGIPTGGQALVHILVAATLQGLIVRGPMIATEQAFVSVESWLGRRPPPMQRTEAVALLASRYLVAHAPASDADLAKWAGITLAEARTGLAAATTGRSKAAEDLPPPRLLGSFDPLLHGWKSRTPVVGEHRAVVTTNGVFRPVALVHGRAVATWTLPAGVVTITPLERISNHDVELLLEDASDVMRYLGLAPRPAVISATRP